MQTFLPFPDFVETARCLDRLRLGKQRCETLQILQVLLGETNGWRNHPAVKMWRGHEHTLWCYGIAICTEWKYRGYKDTCDQKMTDLCYKHGIPFITSSVPPWLGNPKFHSAHRAALLFKNPDYYSQFGWSEKPKLNYIWPVQ